MICVDDRSCFKWVLAKIMCVEVAYLKYVKASRKCIRMWLSIERQYPCFLSSRTGRSSWSEMTMSSSSRSRILALLLSSTLVQMIPICFPWTHDKAGWLFHPYQSYNRAQYTHYSGLCRIFLFQSHMYDKYICIGKYVKRDLWVQTGIYLTRWDAKWHLHSIQGTAPDRISKFEIA